MWNKNAPSFVLLLLLVSITGSTATLDWLANIFGLSSNSYGSPFVGSGSNWGFGGNRKRPVSSYGVTHGGGYLGGSGGASPGGSEYLGGGWTGSGNAGYGNHGGFLGGIGLGRVGEANPFFGGNNEDNGRHQHHRFARVHAHHGRPI